MKQFPKALHRKRNKSTTMVCGKTNNRVVAEAQCKECQSTRDLAAPRNPLENPKTPTPVSSGTILQPVLEIQPNTRKRRLGSYESWFC
jgi:hypothetical protein